MTTPAPQRPPRPIRPVKRRASRGHPPSPTDSELVALIVLLLTAGFLVPVVLTIVAVTAFAHG